MIRGGVSGWDLSLLIMGWIEMNNNLVPLLSRRFSPLQVLNGPGLLSSDLLPAYSIINNDRDRPMIDHDQ